ncbi:MAG: hypothetical protein V4591_06895 [Bdellovibrionota bacterium]
MSTAVGGEKKTINSIKQRTGQAFKERGYLAVDYFGSTHLEKLRAELEMLQDLATRADKREFWSTMKDVESRFENYKVRKESKEVGLVYLQFAETRKNSPNFSDDWSRDKKREYWSETLRYASLAEMYLNATQYVDITQKTCLDNLKFTCKSMIEIFDPQERLDAVKSQFGGGIFDDPELIKFLFDEGWPTPEELEAADGAFVSIEQGTEDYEKPQTKEDTFSMGSETRAGLVELSEFSSEVHLSQIDEPDEVWLSVAEFDKLPASGQISPYKLRFAQGGINPKFRDGKSLDEMRQFLIQDPDYTNKIPEIEIGVHLGKVYSFDTRRLVVHMQAKEQNPAVMIRYKKISGEHLQQRVDSVFSPKPWNGGVTALRYGGKGSESKPYINPALRKPLEPIVNKIFKCYPSEREGVADDANGFPVKRQKAKKIFEFFKDRAQSGSKSAKNVLEESKKIKLEKGEMAAYDFLIEQKMKI